MPGDYGCRRHRSGQRPDWRHFLHDVINVMVMVVDVINVMVMVVDVMINRVRHDCR